MENARRLLDLWAWLPAFRAAAETEHLPSAAAKLHLTPSALSRSVRLLEESLGQKLFDRTGRRLVLNQLGRSFLSEVRTAMRVVDDGVEALTGNQLRGVVRLSVSPDFSDWLVAPTMLAQQAKHPELQLELMCIADNEVPKALHQGALDVAVVHAAIDTQQDGCDLSQEHLLGLHYGVYARPGHPLAAKGKISQQTIRQHAFVAAPGDGFPAVDRERATKATDLRSAASLAARSDLLVCLPTVIGEPSQLERLECRVATKTDLYLAYRRPVATHARTETLLSSLRESIAGAAR